MLMLNVINYTGCVSFCQLQKAELVNLMDFMTLKTNLAVEFPQHVRFSSNLQLNGPKITILANFMNLLWGN